MEGAPLDIIIRKINSKYQAKLRCDMLYVHTGVNNLTCKTGPTVQPIFDNIPDLVDCLTDKITDLKTKLWKQCENVIVAQIVGIDLAQYNHEPNIGIWYYHQRVFDESMPILAHTIHFINRADNLVGPWLMSTVHDYVNNTLYNRYGKLKDSLHPSVHTQEKWDKLFAKSMLSNYEKLYVKL